jgi:glycosyltransferase involved in cell wall biosynthesis
MNIGLVIYGSLDTVSGGYLYDRKLVAYLRSRGDELSIISLPSGKYVPHLLDNLHFRLPHGLDVLIEDELVHPSLLVANSARTSSRSHPVVSLVHNLHSSEQRASWENAIYRRIEARHLRSVDGHIFNSVATRASVHALLGDKIPYIIASPGGDRLGTLGLEKVMQRNSAGGPLRLLFLANVTPLKGLHVLLDALSRLPAGACTLDVAGSLTIDASYAKRTQERAAALSSPVSFHGVLDGASLIDLLARSQVLVLPSFYEGFGIAYLEGMAFGLPAIGTSAGAIPQMIAHGDNGYLISPGDAAALATLIQGLAADRQLLVRLSSNALNYFHSCPTWEQSAEKIRSFLLDMVSSAGLSRAQ